MENICVEDDILTSTQPYILYTILFHLIQSPLMNYNFIGVN